MEAVLEVWGGRGSAPVPGAFGGWRLPWEGGLDRLVSKIRRGVSICFYGLVAPNWIDLGVRILNGRGCSNFDLSVRLMRANTVRPYGEERKSIIAEPIKFHRKPRRGDLWSPVNKF